MQYPDYLYKILPSSATPPSPLPEVLELSALDARDGFIHLSTSYQILHTLNCFFSAEPFVFLLRVPYSRVAKYITWEDTEGKTLGDINCNTASEQSTRFFPHLYPSSDDNVTNKSLKLGCDEVDRFAKWENHGFPWDAEGWPFVEDIPT